MSSCPACGESRWLYPRQHALQPLAKLIGGWEPYTCKSCRWRGWKSVPHDGTLVRLIYRHGRRLAAYLYRQTTVFYEQAAVLAQRMPTVPRLPRPGIGTGLVATLAIGLLAAGALFSARRSSSEPVEPTAVVQPPAPSAPRVEQPVEVSAAVPVSLPAPAAEKTAPPPIAMPPAQPRAVDPPTASGSNTASSGNTSYRGSLLITSDPPGALVAIDGQVIGTTPLVLKDVRAGSRVVRIESSGYERWSAAARVVADKETKLNATLQRGSRP